MMGGRHTLGKQRKSFSSCQYPKRISISNIVYKETDFSERRELGVVLKILWIAQREQKIQFRGWEHMLTFLPFPILSVDRTEVSDWFLLNGGKRGYMIRKFAPNRF